MTSLQNTGRLADVTFYKTLFENHPDAVYIMDPAGNFIWMNEATANLTGYSLEECVNKAFVPSIAVEDIEKARYHFRKVLQGEPQSYEVRMHDRNGRLHVTRTTNVPVMLNGEVVYIYGMAHDFTESKLAQEQLARREKNLAEAQRIAQFGSWEWNVQTNELCCSEGLYRITGATPGTLDTYEKFMSVIYEEDRAYVEKAIEEAFLGKPYNVEFRIRRMNDGMERILYAYSKVEFDEAGKPLRMIGLDHDITEQRQGEWRLQASEERYKMVTEHSMDMITAHSMDGKYLFVSPACVALLGYQPQELLGQMGASLVHPEDLEMVRAHYRSISRGEPAYAVTYRARRKDGTYIWFETMGKMIADSPSERPQLVSVSRDITSRKLLEEERQKTEQLLLQSEKLSIAGQLAAGIAHEIRNPLTAIKGFLQLVGRDTDNPRYIDIMFAEMERIEMILGELLVLAKPQAWTYTVQNLLTIVQDVVTLINPQALLGGVEIVTYFEQDTLLVACDSNQLKQVFINFLKNAIESMNSGGTITIHAHRFDLHQIRLRVVDQGCGIPEERLAKLCEPFYTTKEKGTGLGLMVSKKIIENHQGRMEFTSEVGVGTTVDVYLPLQTQDK